MKRNSRLQAAVWIVCGLVASLMLSQCTKEESVVKNLNRSFNGTSDSTLFASYYNKTVLNLGTATPDVNDVISERGVEGIIKDYCATSNCHGGSIEPKLSTFAQVMNYVTPGNPEASKLWEYVTTSDLNKAMPPIASSHELTGSDKTLLYNWIKNGAKEKPDLSDFRPVAVRLINAGCGSANCHNQATATGAWARKGLIPGLISADTTNFLHIRSDGSTTLYCLLTNKALLDKTWNEYKDSVRMFYQDTLANASFRPYKTFGTPVSSMSTRGPLQTYDDILFDIKHPKGVRSNSAVVYIDTVSGRKYYVKGNNLNSAGSILSRVDSTLLPGNPFTGVFNANHHGGMAYDDGGLKPSEIALIKAWFFADPNVPEVWKYGVNNAGIYKYRKSGIIIKKN